MPDAPSQHTSYFELRDAFGRGGCPLCGLAATAAGRYLERLVADSVTDPDTRIDFAAAHGLCNPHAWQLVDGGSASSIAILYRSLLNDAMRALAAGEAARGEGSGLGWLWRGLTTQAAAPGSARELSPSRTCPACRARDERAAMMAGILLDHLADADLIDAYRVSDGLCLPHLRLVLGRGTSADTRARLVALQMGVWQRLDGELAELIRKFDYRFAREPVGAEADAWMRAVAALAAARGYGVPLPL